MHVSQIYHTQQMREHLYITIHSSFVEGCSQAILTLWNVQHTWHVGKAGRSDLHADIRMRITGGEHSSGSPGAGQCLLQSVFFTTHPLSTILNLAHLVIDTSMMYGLLHLRGRETEMETETKNIVSSAALVVGIPSAFNTLFCTKHSKIPLKLILHFGSSRLIIQWHKSDVYSYKVWSTYYALVKLWL